jgi:hypothetical protein
MARALLLFLAAARAAAPSPLPDLCHLSPLPSFSIYHGNGTGSASPASSTATGACVSLHAVSTTGCAGDFNLGSYEITPLQNYILTMELKTEALLPTPQVPENCVQAQADQQVRQEGGSLLRLGNNQTSCAGAYLTGAPYVSYTDGNGRADGWFPAYGTHATPTSSWHNVSLRFAPPTTATKATIRIAFGAHQYAESNGGRMLGGTATGEVWFRNLRIAVASEPPASVLPATFQIPASEKNLTRAVELAAKCLHNSQISGNFTVGSGNPSPVV